MSDDPLVSTEWLHEHLGDSRVKVVDASWYLPGDPRNPKADYLEARIPGAVFFDIDEISDRASSLPHMVPTPEDFARQVGDLGLGTEDIIVVYDAVGLFSAPRVWWSFRLFGHGKVFVLDGGLRRWLEEERPVEHGPPPQPEPAHFAAIPRPELVRHLTQVRDALDRRSEQVVDFRPAARFRGEAPEPRPGVRAGHMPGAVSLPVVALASPDGRLLSETDLRSAFVDAGVDLERPIVTSCGSGVAASVAALALARLGRWDAAVYDGSWSEWGLHPDTPVVSGP